MKKARLEIRIEMDLKEIYIKFCKEKKYVLSKRLREFINDYFDDKNHFRYAELLLCLPKTWLMGDEEFKIEDNYWPIRWLRTIARLPHEYNTWLGFGHTIPNGEPAQPYSKKTELNCMMLSFPWLVNDSGNLINLKIEENKVINFYSLIPIYTEEMEFKLKKSTESLLKRLEKNQICELVDINRKNTCKDLFFI